MNFDPVWLLLALPIAFGLGWLASRMDLRQLRTENRSAPKAYFKGLNHLLNEQQDQAIDAFIEAVQKDPDTSELHFALGNLFRRRGEYERAIRVHQHLLARADLSGADHDRAQFELAMDFFKAGLLNLAEDALRKLGGSAYATRAQMALLNIYERSRDWQNAETTARVIEQGGADAPDFTQRRAHHLCEQALVMQQKGQHDDARLLLQQASSTALQAARPRIQHALLEKQQGNLEAAWTLLQQALQQTPQAAPLFAKTYAELAHANGQTQHAIDQLQALQARAPSMDVVDALVWLDAQQGQSAGSAQRYLAHLATTPSLVAATRWLDHEKLADDPQKELVNKALHAATKPLGRYRCAACGFEAHTHYWQCPGCQTWDSYPPQRVEEL